MTALEFVTNLNPERLIQYFEKGKLPKLGLAELLNDYAKIKCTEQRQLCANNADADFYILSGAVEEAYNFSIDESSEELPIEVYVIKSTILDTPEPEM